uniref:Methionyl aminopeptidase 1 n=1 Tax=Cyclopterus lumpus TaxID=8103 RepID=A0A8C2ZC03_CYCLU
MASTEARRECETEGCSKDAKLQCPTCIKLGIEGSYFCSQECFKGSWVSHKLLHKKAKDDKNQNESKNCVENDINTDPWPGYRYTGKLHPHYPLTPMRHVPGDIQRPDYADHPRGISESEQFLKGTSQIKILCPEDIEGMRVVCKLAREVLDIAALMVKVGVTTEEIDHAVHLACTARSCYPSPLNYYNFPKSCCTSVNEVICHGIPDRRLLQEGDILNVDITVYHNGFHGDLNETFYIGEVDEEAKKLVQTTYECLMQSIDSGRNTTSFILLMSGFTAAPTLSSPRYAVVFVPPCVALSGGWQDETWPDGWTAVTRDGKRSAQFEHTLLVTETGCEILTRRMEDNGRAHFLNQV